MSRLIIFILSVMLLLGTGARANELLKALEKNKSKTNVDRNKSNFDKDKIIAKEIILTCKVIEYIEYDNNNNLIKGFKREQISNPQLLDGYFHYNPNQKFIVSNLGRLSDYGEIFEGKNSKTTFLKSFGEKTLSFYITFGSDPGNIFDDSRIQHSFIFDKYDLRMTARAYTIGKPDNERQVSNYQCQQTTKVIP
jgi:hypothetical protein